MSLSTIEKVLFLRGVELFRGIRSEDLVYVAQIAYEVHYPAGTYLLRQGELGDYLYIIFDGECSIVIEGVGTIATRGAGTPIGELAIFSREPRTAHCIALTDVTVLRIEHDDFWELMAEQPDLAQGVIRVLAHRYYEAVGRLQQLGIEAGSSVEMSRN